MKRLFPLAVTFAAVLALAATFTPSTRIYPRIFRGTPGRVLAQLAVELPCPSGDSPAFFAGSVTQNPANNSLRYNFCVTSTGHLFYQGDGGGTPGGVNGSVQFNNAGALGGANGFTYDGNVTVSLGNGGSAALVLNSSSSVSASGAVRLPITGGNVKSSVAWRNSLNNADLNLLPDGADKLNFAGTGVCMADGTNCPASSGNEFPWTEIGSVSITNAIGVCSTTSQTCIVTVLPSAHTLVRFTYLLITAPVGCSTQPVIGVRDLTASSNVTTASIANGATLGLVDSGALSVAMTAGHTFGLGIITSPAGCSTSAVVFSITAVLK